MKEYIIRNKTVPGISSSVLRATDKNISLEKAVENYGIDFVLSEIFSEDATYEELMCAYQTDSLENSSMFSRMYELMPGYGLVLDAHITVCYFDADFLIQQEKSLPWIYVNSQKYMGDTWWYENREIINDIKELPTIEFLKKYKGI